MVVVALCLCGHYPLPSLCLAFVRFFFRFFNSFCLFARPKNTTKRKYIHVTLKRALSVSFTFSNPFRFFNYLSGFLLLFLCCLLMHTRTRTRTQTHEKQKKGKIKPKMICRFFYYYYFLFCIFCFSYCILVEKQKRKK